MRQEEEEGRKYWSMEWWSGGVVECWSAGVLECWSGGVVECWSAGSKRRPGKSTGLLGISYANNLPRGRGGGIRVGGEQPFDVHREVFSYSDS